MFAKSDIAKPGLCQFDIVAQLQKAAQTVEYVAKHTTLAKRCSKYLAAIIQVVQALRTSHPAYSLPSPVMLFRCGCSRTDELQQKTMSTFPRRTVLLMMLWRISRKHFRAITQLLAICLISMLMAGSSWEIVIWTSSTIWARLLG